MDVQGNEVDFEEGELTGNSEDEVYTPLQRPAMSNITEKVTSPLTSCHQIKKALDDTVVDDEDDNSVSTTSGESSENCLVETKQRERKKRIRRTVMVRVNPTDVDMQPNRARFKRYNVWTAALQEDALSENMRGCDVTQCKGYDRNVESYDYSIKYRLGGENSLKRRLSNSSGDETQPENKRGRTISRMNRNENIQRHSAKSRLGQHPRNRKFTQRGSSTSSFSDNSCERRNIPDLNDTNGREASDVAREIADKLCEKSEDLILQIVEVLGLDLPIKIFKETQRIEADGGMLIKNGERRRTSGGVFLFLLKNDDSLTPEQLNAIFKENQQITNKLRKKTESLLRDRKVEELKKRLNEQGTELPPALQTRKEIFLLGTELSNEAQATNLSNPPPSPVGHDQSSPEYKAHAINHETSYNNEMPTTSAAALKELCSSKELVSYDDFLDVNCAEMDFF